MRQCPELVESGHKLGRTTGPDPNEGSLPVYAAATLNGPSSACLSSATAAHLQHIVFSCGIKFNEPSTLLAHAFSMRDLTFADPHVVDKTYLELVRTLFATRVPTSIMSSLFWMVAALNIWRTSDLALIVLGSAGSIATLCRLVMLVRYKDAVGSSRLSVQSARMLESSYTRIYLAFAVLLGLFVARSVQVTPVDMQVATVALLVGYAGGVTSGVALRPRIGLAAVALAGAPLIFLALTRGTMSGMVLAIVLTALLAGGISSMRARYQSEAHKISNRHLLASLLHKEQLTGLANRLALEETFNRFVAESGGNRIALHCLDLDGFKPVNDCHGHPAGDQLLKAVAERLRKLARGHDLAVRLGGDEFALLQRSVDHRDEVDLMSRRIVRDLSEPYFIEAREIRIGVSAGYALSRDVGVSLPDLMAAADQSLYRSKLAGRAGSGQIVTEPVAGGLTG